MNNTTQKTPMKFRERFHTGKNSGGERKSFKWSKKKTAVTATAVTLALAMVVTMLPNIGLRTYAEGNGMLTSVSGKTNIPNTYEAVNVSADRVDELGFADNGENGLVAFDFHIFTENFASNAHTCGNVAVQNFGGTVLGESGAPEIGSREQHDTASVKMSYVENPLGWTLVHNDLVLGRDCQLTSNNGQLTLTSGGKSYLFGNDNGDFLDSKYIDDSTDPRYIKIAEELEDVENYQKYLVKLMTDTSVSANAVEVKGMPGWPATKSTTQFVDTTNSIRVLGNNDLFTGAAFGPGGLGMGFGPGGKVIDLKKYPEKTIIINLKPGTTYNWFTRQNDPYHEAINLLSGSVELKGTTGKRVIINIDTDGWDEMKFYDTHMKADHLTNEEESVHSDNNILWNFYDSSKSNGSSTSKIEVGGTWMGSIVAPKGSVYCRAGLNGSIIAKNVATTAETHKSDYTGEKTQGKTNITVKKNWVNDNAASRPDFITVKLYQNDKLYETVQITPPAGDADADQWTYTFKDLPKADKAGKTYKYKIDEVNVAGYKTTVYNYNITNTSEGGTPKVDKYGSLTINKKDGSATLAGAKFKLTSNSGANLSKAEQKSGTTIADFRATDSEVTWVSSASGDTIANLPFGTYTVTEISAPAGYKLASPVTVTLTGEGENVVVSKDITDQPLEAKFIKLESLNRWPLEDAEFVLTPNWGQDLTGVSVTGCKGNATVTGSSITFTSGTTEIVFSKIPAGSYTITETFAPQSPEKYDIAAPVTFVVEDNGNVRVGDAPVQRVEMLDDKTPIDETPVYGGLTFTKTADTGAAISGVEFTITNVAHKDITGVMVGGAEVTPTGTAKDTITFTYNGSRVEITHLLVGNYTVTEGTNPGYKVAAPVSFSVAENQTASVEMTNEAIRLFISKKDMNSGTELSGAKLALYKSNGTTVYEAEWETGEVKEITGIPAGTYILKETKVPDGYNPAADIKIRVDENGNIFTLDGSNADTKNNVDGSIVTMYDEPTVVKVEKTNGSAALAGAGLKLTALSDVDLRNVSGIIEVTHGDPVDGKVKTLTWTSATVAQELRGLPAGSYKLEEESVPSGYKEADDITFSVDASGVITIGGNTADSVVMNDEKIVYKPVNIGKVDLKKYRRTAGAEATEDVYLPGAKLAIFKADEKNLTEENAVRVINTTDKAEQVMLNAPGKYVLVELDPPTQGPKTTGEGTSEVLVTKTEDGVTSIVYEPREYDKTTQRIYFDVDKNGVVTVDGVDQFNENTDTQHGIPSQLESQQLQYTYNQDCYYALSTTEIFKQYEGNGGYPARAEFELPADVTCTSFKIMKENVVDDGNSTAHSVVVFEKTNPEGTVNTTSGKKEYSVNITNPASEYDPTATYLALLELSDQSVTGVKINFVYTIESEGGGGAVYVTGGDASENGVQTFPNGQAIFDLTGKTLPKTIKIILTKSKPYNENEVISAKFKKFRVAVCASEDKNFTCNVGDPHPENCTSQQDCISRYYNNNTLNNDYAQWEKNQNNEISFGNSDTIEITLDYTQWDTSYITSIYRDLTDGLEYFKLYTDITGENIATISIELDYGGSSYDINSAGVSSLNINDIKVEAPAGDTGKYELKLPNKQTDTTKTYPCNLELTKYKTGTTKILPGAKFVLIDRDGEMVPLVKKTVTTGTAPNTTTSVVEAGAYEFSRDAESSADRVNYEKITKVTDDNEKTYDTSDIVALETDDNGKITVTGLKPGDYIMREVSAPDGYILPDETDTPFTLRNSEKVAKDVYNTALTGEIEFIKYDDKDSPKAGAVYELHRKPLKKTTESSPSVFEGTDYYVWLIKKTVDNGDGTQTVSYRLDETVATGPVPATNDNKPTLATGEEIVPFETDSAGKFALTGLPLDSFYYAIEVEPAPGTEIPSGLVADACNEQGYTGKRYSKPLPRTNQTEGDETRTAFYNINKETGAKVVTTGNYGTQANCDAGTRYGIILAQPDSEITKGLLFTLNMNSTADAEKYVNDAASPYMTGTISLNNTATETKILKTDESNAPLAGARFKLERPASTDSTALLNGVSSSTAADLAYTYYAVYTDNSVDREVSLVIGEDGRFVPAENVDAAARKEPAVYSDAQIDTFKYYEYLTWTSTATAEGDVLYGLRKGIDYTLTETEAPAGYALAASDTVTAGTTKTVQDELLYDTVTIRAKKYLTGRAITDSDNFTFTLTQVEEDGTPVAGGITMPNVKADKNGNVTFNIDKHFTKNDTGTYWFKIKEDEPEGTENHVKAGVTYDQDYVKVKVEVEVTMDGNQPKAAITAFMHTDVSENQTTGTNTAQFVNAYNANGTATVNVKKTLNGRDFASGEQFTFILTETTTADVPDKLTENKTAVVTENNGTATFTVPYTAAGEHTYTITEQKGGTTENGIAYDNKTYTWTVTVTDPDGNGQLTVVDHLYYPNETELTGDAKVAAFVNEYSATDTSATLTGSKTLINKLTNQSKEFDDSDYVFTIAECDASWQNPGTAEDITLSGGQFTITKNYTEATAGDHYYIIKEKNTSKSGITYSDAEYHWHVSVTGVGTGTLAATDLLYDKNGTKLTEAGKVAAFTNEYAPVGDVTDSIDIVKTLQNKTLEGGKFSFVITQVDAEGKTLMNEEAPVYSEEVSYSADDVTAEKHTFGKTFTATGDYYFTITEKQPEVEADSDGFRTKDGIKYDKSVYHWHVTVADNGNGGFEVTSSVLTKDSGADAISDKTARFTNTYNTTGISDTVNVKKTLTGRDFADGEKFTIRLHETTAGDNVPDKIADQDVQIGINNGTTSFTVDYTKEFDHTYTITEVRPSTAAKGMTYDAALYTWTVSVKDTGTGAMSIAKSELKKGSAVLTGDDKVAAFVNIFKAVNISKKTINGTGELTGAELTLRALAYDDGSGTATAPDLTGVTHDYGTKNEEAKTITWTSGSSMNAIYDLPAGYYSLKEVTAPDGYKVAEIIYFQVDANGNVKALNREDNGTNELTEVNSETFSENTSSTNNPVSGSTVTMRDAPSTAVFSKKDTAGHELPGAELTLTMVNLTGDFEGKNLAGAGTADNSGGSGFDFANKANETAPSIKWISTDKDAVITGLKSGYYTLHEDQAPLGYSVTADALFFFDGSGKVYPATKNAQNIYSYDATKGGTAITMVDEVLSATFSKVDATGGGEIDGATIEITPVNAPEGFTLAGVAKTAASGGEDYSATAGKITWKSKTSPVVLSKLPAGTYCMTETLAPDGYKKATSIYFNLDEEGKLHDVEITGTGDARVYTPKAAVLGKIEMEDEVLSATFSKVAATGGGEINGATIAITPVNAPEGFTLAGVAKTANSGGENYSATADKITWKSKTSPVVLSKLPAGTYCMTETIAPAGYKKATSIYFNLDEEGKLHDVEITGTGDARVYTPKTAVLGKIEMVDEVIGATISKQATGAGAELPGAVLTVTAKSENVTLDGISSKINAIISDDKKSVIWTSGSEANVLSKLPEGIYELKEETAPNGYAVAEIIYFKIENDGTIKSCTKAEYDKGAKAEWKTPEDGTVIMKDAPNTATISKQEVGGGSELPGARLTVKLETPDKNGATLEGVTSSFGDKATMSDDKLSITWTSEADKKNTLSKLPTGVYSLTEVTSPDGYDVAETIYFKVEKDGTVKSCTKTEYNKGANATWTTVTDKTVIMKDAPLNAVISKQAVGAGDELPGAKLTVKLISPAKTGATLANVTSSFGNKATLSDDKLSISWTSEANNKNTLTKLPAGIYSLTETQAPDGYDIAEVIYFNVKSDGTVECCTETEYKKGASATWTKADNDTVIMKDALKSNGTTYEFTFSKKDTFDAMLAGAKFNLKGTGYDQTAVSDANGKVTFNGLQAGKQYTLTETEAPAGYDKSGSSITVTVDANGNKAYKDFNSTLTLAQVEKTLHNNKTPVDVSGSTDYKIGDTVDLMSQLLKFRPDVAGRQITWRTSDGQVVSVDENGKAIINGVGSAEISAYYGDDKLATFVLGASEETSQIIGDNEVPHTRDLIIKYLKIATIALIISTLVALGCVHLYRRRKAARSAH